MEIAASAIYPWSASSRWTRSVSGLGMRGQGMLCVTLSKRVDEAGGSEDDFCVPFMRFAEPN
ncbi:MAG TPA: hypothetical protein DIC52_15750 [Candidatus Latescibacteria bacterium]|jgi:hypothetical protein|nr:hypothetical protein [Candidatus Latescibacterota bacterium]